MGQRFLFGEFELDLARRELRHGGACLDLQPKVFAVLALLVQNPDRALSKDDFLDRVWSGRFVTENVLTRCIRQLRKVLKDDPSEPTFIKTLHGFGYQFVAPLRSPDVRNRADLVRVAVLPFEPLVSNRAAPELELGLADTLVHDLSRVDGLIVRPLNVATDATKRSGPADPVCLGQILDVDVIIEGRMQLVGKRVRLNIRALRVPEGTALMAERFEEQLTDLFKVQDALSKNMLGALAPQLAGDSIANEIRRGTTSVKAYQAYVAGRLRLSEHSVAGIQAALDEFQQALELDPHYLEPLLGVAEANDLMASLGVDSARYHEETRKAAQAVIAADPERAGAYCCLGKVAWQSDRDYAKAEALFRRAAGIDPGNAETLIALSDYLCYQGRYDEALGAAERAGEINPFSPWIQALIAQALYMGRHFEEAREQARRALEQVPDFGFSQFFLGLSLFQLDRYDEAIGWLEKAVENTGRGDFSAALGHVLARAGHRERARRMLAEMYSARDGGAKVPAIALSLLHLGLGEEDEALRHFQQVMDQRSWHVLLLHSDPLFAQLRARPEGLALLREAGFTRRSASRRGSIA